ncbi:MAG: hypothetical protein PW843_08770 [Azospirillaceae bacterium]|nr:hypothetical protein [Azospirillaceae bacterium]
MPFGTFLAHTLLAHTSIAGKTLSGIFGLLTESRLNIDTIPSRKLAWRARFAAGLFFSMSFCALINLGLAPFLGDTLLSTAAFLGYLLAASAGFHTFMLIIVSYPSRQRAGLRRAANENVQRGIMTALLFLYAATTIVGARWDDLLSIRLVAIPFFGFAILLPFLFSRTYLWLGSTIR